VFDALSIAACVSRRALPGGPAPDTVRAAIEAGEAMLAAGED
jgi:argininosuccinate lyase